jgi:hypothetical protein
MPLQTELPNDLGSSASFSMPPVEKMGNPHADKSQKKQYETTETNLITLPKIFLGLGVVITAFVILNLFQNL